MLAKFAKKAKNTQVAISYQMESFREEKVSGVKFYVIDIPLSRRNFQNVYLGFLLIDNAIMLPIYFKIQSLKLDG